MQKIATKNATRTHQTGPVPHHQLHIIRVGEVNVARGAAPDILVAGDCFVLFGIDNDRRGMATDLEVANCAHVANHLVAEGPHKFLSVGPVDRRPLNSLVHADHLVNSVSKLGSMGITHDKLGRWKDLVLHTKFHFLLHVSGCALLGGRFATFGPRLNALLDFLQLLVI